MKTIYDFEAKKLDGKPLNFSEFKGKPLLIVNTASKCGFTPQYEGLEKLQQEYAGKGLVIMGFPCNQFGAQEPGAAEEIGAFCQKNYGVSFTMFEKIDVNGAGAHPLYEFLKEKAPGILGTKAIKWNFTKFLVSKDGSKIERFAPDVKPENMKSDIEKLL